MPVNDPKRWGVFANAGIQSRLVVVTTLMLTGFLSLAGWVLDRSFRASVLTGVEEQLRVAIYSLMGVAELDAAGIRVDEPPDPRLSQPESGLYAVVQDMRTERIWRSPSALTTNVEMAPVDAALGEFRFSEVRMNHATRFVLTYLVIWDDADESELVFQVAADQAPAAAAVRGFRRTLLSGFGAATLLFIAAQILAIRWGLKPLRTMAQEVRELEEGRRSHLSDAYPGELAGLRGNLERFVDHEQRRRIRYRNALEDLAHSLKTPLAVIRNALHEPPLTGGAAPPGRQLIAEQLEHMESTVAHQLSKARVVGPVVVGKPVDVGLIIVRLVRALKTAYASRSINTTLDLPQGLTVRGDEADLMEIFGNLLENAFKYTRSEVRIRGHSGAQNILYIEDDGAGVNSAIRDHILNRGARGDQAQPGQGIGLSVVSELVALYGGALEIGDSALGGARLVVQLPR